MLVLYDTPAGFALFKVTDESKIASEEDVTTNFETAKSAKKILKLKAFHKFDDTDEALAAASTLIEGQSLDKGLKSFLKKECKKSNEKLAVIDTKFGNLIKEKLDIPCVYDKTVGELFRGIRMHLTELVDGLEEDNVKNMSVGLAHSLARHKLKFSPDKVDTMIIQAIGLLDDLDKELNTYAMRVREWYGWHFPELAKVVNDNLMFALTIKKMGMRTNAAATDFSDILPEEMETEMKQKAIISMGTEISQVDLDNILLLADQVITISEYRVQLFDYLKNRMTAIAPNLTVMVGELVGARLISHAGSLLNLAKHPASTVQILGAEKALFRALKTKKETPKYGLIYHASLVGQSGTKHKGRISRVLAAKTALSVRVDALGDATGATIALTDRIKVESRLRQLEGGAPLPIPKGATNGKAEKYDGGSVGAYNTAADTVMDTAEGEDGEKKKKKKEKKEKKEKKAKDGDEKKKKKKKRKEGEDGEEPPKKKKKKKKSSD